MSQSLTRTHLRAIAEAKLYDAALLLAHKRYSNAYYLAGYAVELGLKACIAAQMAAETIPAKEILKGLLDHSFPRLVGLAGLKGLLAQEIDSDANFSANWAVVSEWLPDARYEVIDAMSAQELIQAINDPQSGILKWIKAHW